MILLLIKDEARQSRLKADLAEVGQSLQTVGTTDELTMHAASDPSMMVLDGDSFPLGNRLYQPGGASVPVLALVPEARLPELQLNGHVDDFLLEPYRKPELVTRVLRLMKGHDKAQENVPVVLGDVTIDEAEFCVTLNGQKVDLAYKEYALLKYLAERPDKVFTRETLLAKVWGPEYFGGARTVDVHVRRLRSKLASSQRVSIETVRNVGYRLRASHQP
ncbi:MAG: response regulator transcription factor [Chloroflexi bacterium]|nr:response regulator transcription factor [Chloroflexota bacterium]